MRVFGVHQEEHGESWPVYPLYMKLSDAIKFAEELVFREQGEVKKMQDFQRANGETIDYMDWRKTDDYVWTGGYKDSGRVSIEAIEVIR